MKHLHSDEIITFITGASNSQQNVISNLAQDKKLSERSENRAIIAIALCRLLKILLTLSGLCGIFSKSERASVQIVQHFQGNEVQPKYWAGRREFAMSDTGTGKDCANSGLLPNADHGRWIILRTHSRQERILAAVLRARKLPHFLPLAAVEKFYCGQSFIVEVPVFPGYVFLRGRAEDVASPEFGERIKEVIDVHDQKQLDTQLNNLAQVLAFHSHLEQHPYLRHGVQVKVRSGPLAGIEALVADRGRMNPLVLQVEALSQAVSVGVESAEIEPI
jgi:transcription antitermination factor NusG